MRHGGHPEDLCRQWTREREGLEHDHLGVELATDAQYVVDHVVDRDLAERPGKEVVEDAFRRNSVAGNATGPRRQAIHHLCLATSRLFESCAGLLDDRSRFRPRRHQHVVPGIEQGTDERQERSHVPGTRC